MSCCFDATHAQVTDTVYQALRKSNPHVEVVGTRTIGSNVHISTNIELNMS